MTMNHSRFAPALALALLVALSMSATRARAAGFDTARFGSEHGHAAGSNPFAVYYNPAALTGTRRIHLAVDLSLLSHGAYYDRTETTTPPPADAVGANTGETKAIDVAPLPSLAASFRFGDFALGAGAYAPVSGQQRWQGNDDFRGNTMYPGARDGTARWHLIHGDILLAQATLAGAYHIRPARLSLGVGVSSNLMRMRIVRALAPSLDDDVSLEQRVRIEGASVVGSFSAGFMVEPLEGKLWLAASYQSPPGFYREMHLDGTVRTSLGGTVAENDSTIHQYWPDVLRWAARARPSERYELRLFGDYTRWSRLERQCVTKRSHKCDVDERGAEKSGTSLVNNQIRDWNDSFGVRAGGSYYPTARSEVFLGLGYDSNAVPDATLDPTILDGHKLSAALGGRMQLLDSFGLLASYTHIQQLERDITGKSKLDDPDIASLSRLPSGGGRYSQWFGYFALVGELTFD
jgi:long-chain fatty acid transport protein